MKDFAGLHVLLLTLSLTEGGKALEAKDIETWPSSLIETLFKKSQRLSSLTTEESEKTGEE
jgi:hypothetical protein